MSPRFLFIMVVIIIYLFVLDDSLTSKRFLTRTKQLSKCCEPLHRQRIGTPETKNTAEDEVEVRVLLNRFKPQ